MDINDQIKLARSIATAPGKIRTAGRIEFVRDTGPLRRDIRVDGFKWSKNSLKNLTKIIWAAQRSHSYAVTALRLLSRMPSSEFSPDGLLGGRGYIQNIKDLRNSLSQASETLSNFTDTIYDEINADHWNPASTVQTNKLLQEAKQIKQNPEGFVQGEYRQEGESDKFLDAQAMNPTPQEMGMPDQEGQAEPQEAAQEGFNQRAAASFFANSSDSRWDRSSLRSDTAHLTKFDRALDKLLSTHKARVAAGKYESDPSTLSGPRVDHIGPGMGGEYGWYNDNATPSDDPGMTGFYQNAPIYEDGNEDGVTGDDNPTDGDVTFLKTAANDRYSWLPGSDNSLIMPYYDRGVTAEETEVMRARSVPPDPRVKTPNARPDTSWLWGK